jgi:hypothetical protein
MRSNDARGAGFDLEHSFPFGVVHRCSGALIPQKLPKNERGETFLSIID